jgi:transcriptional regulator with XRE-family HTH domain
VTIARIAEIVRRGRLRQAWSEAQLADQAGVPPEIVHTLEAGGAGITRAQLAAIAHVLALDSRALAQGSEVAQPKPSVFLRHRAMQDFHDVDLAVLDAALEQGRMLRELGQLLGDLALSRSGPPSDAPRDRPEAAAQDGYRLATDLRRQIGEPARPFDDLRETVEALGVAVLVRKLSVRGACAVTTGDASAIVLDAATYADRPVWAQSAIAHELCHVLNDPIEQGVHIVLDAEQDRSTHANEQRARGYAAELLLPRPGLQGLLGLPAHVTETGAAIDLVVRAMDHYGTSWEMTANHLCNRGFVARDLRVWLEAKHAHSARTTWPLRLPMADAPSVVVAARTRRAHDANRLTDGEARGFLGLSVLAPLPWELGP